MSKAREQISKYEELKKELDGYIMDQDKKLDQKIDFVYGNLMCSTNHKVCCREFVAAQAYKMECKKLRDLLEWLDDTERLEDVRWMLINEGCSLIEAIERLRK